MSKSAQSGNGTRYWPALRRAQRSLKAGFKLSDFEGLDGKAQLLAALCREFQREAGAAPFFISVRLVARVLNVEEPKAAQYLRLLVSLKVLQVVERGDWEAGRASTYRYVSAGRVMERPADVCPGLRV